jgi:aryl-alcohol dehydrogenase-like predicted oxidoreductase
MDYRRLGTSGPTVSTIALGSMNFGTYVDEPATGRLIDQAVAGGVNLVDTADVYGWGANAGLCESIIGRYLAGRPGRRDEVVLATKLYRRMADWPNNEGLSALHIRRGCEASLRRLRTDRIDLLQFHHFDRRVPVEEVWEAIDVLVRQGKIVHCGSSNFAAWQLVSAQLTAQRHTLEGLVGEQSVYNLLTRFIELEVLPACRDLGLGVLAWSPLCDGLLAGPANGIGRRAEARNLAKAGRHQDVLTRFYSWCTGQGLRPAEVAIAWILHQPATTSVVVGPRTSEQLTSSLAAQSLALTDDQLAELDATFPPVRYPSAPGSRVLATHQRVLTD